MAKTQQKICYQSKKKTKKMYSSGQGKVREFYLGIQIDIINYPKQLHLAIEINQSISFLK